MILQILFLAIKEKRLKNKIPQISSINKEIFNKRVEELNFNELLEIYKFFLVFYLVIYHFFNEFMIFNDINYIL